MYEYIQLLLIFMTSPVYTCIPIFPLNCTGVSSFIIKLLIHIYPYFYLSLSYKVSRNNQIQFGASRHYVRIDLNRNSVL